MGIRSTIQKTLSVGGVVFTQSKTPLGDGMIVHNQSIAAGDLGSLSTRTDADTGVVTVDDSGHAFNVGDRVDIYWAGGCRRGMAVTVVSGALITVDSGDGDDLPSQGVDVTIIEPTLFDIVVLGTNVNAILLGTEKLGQFSFVDSSAAEDFQKEVGAGCVWDWLEDNGETNPITGDSIAGVYVSHGHTAACLMKVGIVYDN